MMLGANMLSVGYERDKREVYFLFLLPGLCGQGEDLCSPLDTGGIQPQRSSMSTSKNLQGKKGHQIVPQFLKLQPTSSNKHEPTSL